jgi:sulfur-oxidizing protein SoxX
MSHCGQRSEARARSRVRAFAAAGVALVVACGVHAQAPGLPLAVVGDGVPQPLTDDAPVAARGRALLVARESANCVLCHAVPDAAVRFSGNVGPSLAGAGARFTAAQLRLRVADNGRLNPQTVMPSYYRVDGLDRVADAYRGKPVLTAREVEDVVAYLSTLR